MAGGKQKRRWLAPPPLEDFSPTRNASDAHFGVREVRHSERGEDAEQSSGLDCDHLPAGPRYGNARPGAGGQVRCVGSHLLLSPRLTHLCSNQTRRERVRAGVSRQSASEKCGRDHAGGYEGHQELGLPQSRPGYPFGERESALEASRSHRQNRRGTCGDRAASQEIVKPRLRGID